MISKTAKTAMAIFALAGAVSGAGCATSYGSDSGPGSRDYASDPNYAGYTYYADQCQSEKHDRNVAGTAIGAIAGGLVGNAVSSGGGKTGGTIIGAVAGAAVGSNIARSSVNCDGSRAYWTRDQTMDYSEYSGYRGRHDDAWYRQHDCRWVRNERDNYVRVCRGANDRYYTEY